MRMCVKVCVYNCNVCVCVLQDGFVEFFHVEDPESAVWNTLVAMAGVGLGACLFTLMR